ncbi:hypothetical protein [Virgibacillus halodenitrificans]|uniref:hypothetical protein n=1 Tax=Virgibacillus halodenitrificans TaxID=1482 RepID=UPI000EF44C52|nr:hypothetical protein [Virgibacillus halodenitrificans]
MNVVQNNDQEKKIKNLYQRLHEIKLLFSEGKMKEEIYLEEEKALLDSLETMFINRNIKSVFIQ